MHKRGVSQVDWVISLAIFLLYIAWFFLFIRPLSVQQGTPNLVDNIMEKISQEAYATILDYPVIIESSVSITREPVIVDTILSNQENSFMLNKSFFLLAGKLFFLENILPGTTVQDIINSNETYTPYTEITDLMATNNSVSADGIDVELNNNLVQTADFNGPKIFSYNLYADNVHISSSNLTFSNFGIAAIYPVSRQFFNATNIFFSYNSRIYTLFQGVASISQNLEIYKYENYFFDSNNNGGIATGGCYNHNSDMVEFFTQDSVMLIIFSKNADISFCGKNSSMDLNLNFGLNGTAMQKIIFYQGSPGDFAKYKNGYSVRMGIPYQITGLSLFNLELLNITNYNNLKARWGVGDFRVTVINSTNDDKIIEFGGTPYEKATVYARENRGFLVDKFGNLEDVKISVQAWT